MPKLKSPSKTYPKMFPAGYSGSQILRAALGDGPQQRLYTSGDFGLGDHKNLPTSILGFIFFSGVTNLGASIGMHQPQNLSASVIGSYCQTITPKRYIIGYEDGVPQFLETRQRYQCVSFISSYLKSFSQASRSMSAAIKVSFSETKDLETFIIAGKEIFSSYANLTSVISGYGTLPGSLLSSITGVQCQSLGPQQYVIGYEDGVPQFLAARHLYRCVSFLSGFIRSTIQITKNLPVIITPSRSGTRDLGTQIVVGRDVFSSYRNLGTIISGFGTTPGSISASIIGTYCQTLFGKRYFIGYEDGVPQYVDGRTTYRCVAFLPASINQVWYRDLGAFIWAQPIYHEEVNLPAYIDGKNLQKYRNLGALIYTPIDLSASIRGWAIKDLVAYITGFTYEDLPASIYPVPPIDLPGYLKVWPMAHLPGRIHGWEQRDLGAFIDWNIAKNLPAFIGIHPPKDLGVRLRAWARGVTADLGAFIDGFTYEDLGATIRANYFDNLPAEIYPIAPKDLPAFIHGWDIKNLLAYINGVYGDGDLHASITGVSYDVHPTSPQDLSASIRSMYYRDLGAYIYGSRGQGNLGAYIGIQPSYNLTAFIYGDGLSNLGATIVPKIVLMTTIVDIITKEHLNLNALINICVSSHYRDLAAFLQCSYISDMSASIEGTKVYTEYSNLGAKIGYADTYVELDKIPITLDILSGYITEDKIPLSLRIMTQCGALSASIVGLYRNSDMSASITGTWLHAY